MKNHKFQVWPGLLLLRVLPVVSLDGSTTGMSLVLMVVKGEEGPPPSPLLHTTTNIFYPAVSSVSLQLQSVCCDNTTISPFSCSNITQSGPQYFWDTLGVVAPVE